MFFKDLQHKERFANIIALSSGFMDEEYGSAFYILSSDQHLWESAKRYIDQHDHIQFEEMLKEVHFSHGYEILINLAWNLFNGYGSVQVVDFCLLDSGNYEVAIQAIRIRCQPNSLKSLRFGVLHPDATNTFSRNSEEA